MTDAFAGLRLRARDRIDTPAGVMTALATEAGLAALLFDNDRHHAGPFDHVPRHPQDRHVKAARDWLAAYWRGEDPGASDVALDLHGTTFQVAVWQVLLRIPQGSTWTYGDVARAVGGDAVPRATGAAIGRNPVAVLVPCHRVIGADGSLTGYAAGLPCKERLLQHEGALLV
jgi:methylated-DNA-[protein]-cysteine S-methyltransferase